MEDIDLSFFEWLVGGLFGVLASIGSFAAHRLNSRLDEIENDLSGIQGDLSRRSERISVLEAHIDTVNRRLDRIETKLDLLLEAKRP